MGEVGGKDCEGNKNVCEMKHNNQEGIIMLPLKKTTLVSILVYNGEEKNQMLHFQYKRKLIMVEQKSSKILKD